MKITANQYARSLYELTAGKPEREINDVVENFMGLLRKRNQTKLAGKIVEKFSEIWNDRKGIVEAQITSREKLDDGLRKHLRGYVSNRYKAKEVILEEKIDASLRGGVVVRVGDEILDGSVAGQLNKLKNILEK